MHRLLLLFGTLFFCACKPKAAELPRGTGVKSQAASSSSTATGGDNRKGKNDRRGDGEDRDKPGVGDGEDEDEEMTVNPEDFAPKIDCSKEKTNKSSAAGAAVELIIKNNSGKEVEIFWLDAAGQRKSYGRLGAGDQRTQSTYRGHPWLLADTNGECLFVVANLAQDATTVCVGEIDASCVKLQRPLDPFYRQTLDSDGILVVAGSAVQEAALERASSIIEQMLLKVPEIRDSMRKGQFRVEIIGKDQVLSDLPDYRHLKNQTTADGRSYDEGTRGVCNASECSVGEENLLCLDEQSYPNEDIMVHEFAHGMKFHFDTALTQASDRAYQNAYDQGLYDHSIYMMQNAQEYWAEGVQAWLGKTLRTDVNDGFNTLAKLKSHDPNLAEVLARVFAEPPVRIAKAHSGCDY